MNNIILKIVGERLKNIEKDFSEVVLNQTDFSKFTENLEKRLKSIGKDICKTFLEDLNKVVKDDPKRKKSWVVERKSDKNTLLTVFGEIEYERTYYWSKNKEIAEYKYLSDELVGITPHQRLDTLVEARMIDRAIELSYHKSGEPYEVSKQAVMESIKELENIKFTPLIKEKKEVEYLYIEADEDHVANQNDGSTLMPKIIYIHEGYEDILGETKKKKLKNVYYISGIYKTEDIWNEVNKYISKTYDTDRIKKIYISGDGAGWIKSGKEYIEKSELVLDKYHTNKYIMQATGHIPELRSKIWRAINKCDKKFLKKHFEEALICVDSSYRAEKVEECRKYILNNWNAIKIRITEKEQIIGCSAEGHVSHLLSARLSSRPLGWCIEGADKMARLRSFKFNGGNVYELILKNKKHDKIKLPKDYLNSIKKAIKENYRNNEVKIPVIQTGKRTQLYNILKHLNYA